MLIIFAVLQKLTCQAEGLDSASALDPSAALEFVSCLQIRGRNYYCYTSEVLRGLLMKDTMLKGSLFLFLILETGQETIKCSKEMSLFDIYTSADLFLGIN